MTSKRMKRIHELHVAAAGLPPDQRSAFLAKECGGDVEVLGAVKSLLEGDLTAAVANRQNKPTVRSPHKAKDNDHPHNTETIETINAVEFDENNKSLRLPAAPQIDGYEIVRELSRGGQGIVYQAIQKSTKRKVAIKFLLAGGQAAKSDQRRFEREIELIAQLRHPNIISVFHSGQTSNGRSYYVMDYIRGLPLNQYVRQCKLTLEQMLKLFGVICEATQYAHQKGMIHRDLKPSNILVDADGNPKVLDFGLAKLLAGPVDTEVSITQEVFGTLPYMSPEHARGNPDEMDTRSDVYALGVILYELLTGHYPYPVVGQVMEVLRHITDTPPTPPCRSWKGEPGVTRRNSRRLRPGQCPIDDEVQTIVLRALSKERERRYQSAGDLGLDIERYLAGDPIEAKRDSGWYILRKSLRRYRGALVTAAMFVILLMLGAAITTALWLHADEQRALADAKTAEAQTARAEAESAREAAEAEAYVANLIAVDAALSANESVQVRARLDACPPERRGWEWRWLNARSDTSLIELPGEIATFSPDGTLIVTTSSFYDFSEARIWDTEYGNELIVLHGHDTTIDSVAFSPDGARVITGSLDGTARLWDIKSGKLLVVLGGHTEGALKVAFSPDGTRIGTASVDKTVRVWDSTGKQSAILRKSTVWIESSTFSTDGTRIVTESAGKALVSDVETGRELVVLHGRDWITSAAFSPDDARIVTTSLEGTASIWDALTGKELVVLHSHEGPITSTTFSPDGSRILTGSADQTARVWDARNGKLLVVLRGHSGLVWSAEFSPDCERIITTSKDRTARVWDVNNGVELTSLRGHVGPVVSAADFSADGTRIRVSSHKNTRVWDINIISVPMTLRGDGGYYWSAAFDPDDKRIITAEDQTARVWDVNSCKELVLLRGHDDRIQSAAFNSDGMRIVTASWDATARIWDAYSGSMMAVLRGHEDRVLSAAFSPNGDRIVTGSYDGTTRVWDADRGKELINLRGHTGAVRSAAFSPDGARIVTASEDGTARVWDAAAGTSLVELKGHANYVYSAAFSQDGLRIVTASLDDTARAWDAKNGEELAVFRGHENQVYSASFSPDGTRIVTASRDGTARVWDTAGKELAVLRGHEAEVVSAAFSRDGTRIVTASWDSTVRVWDSVPYRERYAAIAQARSAEAKMAPLVRELIERGVGIDEIEATLERNHAMSPDERTAVHVELCAAREEAYAARLQEAQDQQSQANDLHDATILNFQAWENVRFSTLDDEAVREALSQARRAVALSSDNGAFLNTLGVALYRAREYDEALSTLIHSAELNAASISEQPSDWAFIAMAQAKLGRLEKAREALDRLRALADLDGWKNDEETLYWLKEAVELIAQAADIEASNSRP